MEFAGVIGDKKGMQEKMEKAIDYVQAQGDNALYVYLFFTFVGVVCLVPTTPMEFAGGFLFSPQYGMWGVLFMTSFAKLCANTVSVLIARYVVKDWVHNNLVKNSELLTMVSQAVKEEPFKMAFLVRGSMVPLCVKNYGLGCMDIKEVFAPKKKAADDGDWSSTIKACLPIAFNVALVIFLVKAVKAQIKKQKNKIEEQTKEKLSDKKK